MSKISFVKNLIGFSMSAWVNAALSFFATPLITRTFVPEDLGKINMFITFVNLFLNFSYLGIDQAFTRFYHEPIGKNDKKSILTVCLILSGIILLFVAAGIVVFHNVISETIIGYAGFVIPMSLIVSVLSQMLIRYFNLAARMEKNIVLFNVQAVLSTIISNISYVAVALISATSENAIIFRTLLTFAAALVFLFIALKSSMSTKVDCSKSVIKKIMLYALPVCPATILSVFNNSMGQVLMKTFVDYSAIGIYSNAVTIAAIITIIQSGFNSYWSPFVYENYKTQQKTVMQMHHLMSFAIIVFSIVIICFQDLIYLLLVGKMYWESKQLFPLLIISPVCYTVAETLGIGIRLSKKTYLNIPVAVVNIVVNLLLCYILLPLIGVIGAATASAASAICMLILRAYWGEKQYKCSDNYLKLIVAMSTLVITAVIHVFVYTNPIKYVVYLLGLLVVCMMYLPQIKMIVGFGADIINKVRRSK